MIKVGLIDYYLDEYHAANYPGWLREASGGEILPLWAWAKMDKPDGKTNYQCCEETGVALLSNVEEVIERSDCLIVMSPDNPEQHEELCRLPLASGKPTYVDKTFAPDRDAARRIIQMAEKGGTPFFSTSALRFAPEYAELRQGAIEYINSRGPGLFSNYAIHQIEPIVSLMGAGVGKIMFTGTANTPSLVLRYRDGRCATMAQLGWECDFSIAAAYSDGHAAVSRGATDFYPQFILQLAQFFRDGKPKVSPEETLQVITLLEYGRKAMDTPDTWIELPTE